MREIDIPVDLSYVLSDMTDEELLDELKSRRLKVGHHPHHDELLLDLQALFEDMARSMPIELRLRDIAWKYFGKVLP